MKAWQKSIFVEGSLPHRIVRDAAATLQPRPLPRKPSHTVLWHSMDPDHEQHTALPTLPRNPLDNHRKTWSKTNIACGGVWSHTSLISMWPTRSKACCAPGGLYPIKHRHVTMKHQCASHPYGSTDGKKRFGSDEATKTTALKQFQTRPREISVKGIHWLVCQWDTCLNKNEDSFIWTTQPLNYPAVSNVAS